MFAKIIDDIIVSLQSTSDAEHQEAVPGSVLVGASRQPYGWANPPLPYVSAPIPTIPPKISVIEYKMLFTSAERIATKNSTDPVIVDLQELMNDPRTLNVDLSLKSVQDALDYMTFIGILAPGRKDEILTGQVK